MAFAALPLHGGANQPNRFQLCRTFKICRTTETCVRVGLCSGGHGVPPLPLYGFIFITAETRVRIGLCMAGMEAATTQTDI